ncbi:MAG: spore coat protein CotJB [Bacilli bacterium]|nr:spore coat protein CotJB [Bacilli bacterium]MDD4643728.1 spore coat protein CotJB [Bacilli bacterium]
MMYNYYNYNVHDYMEPAGISSPNISAIPQTYNQKLYTPSEGFIRGNMFPNLYDPYITAEPFKLNPQTENEALLNQVREYTFSLIDLNLYLDTHPNDSEVINLYNQFVNQLKQAKMAYENKFGPLTLGSETLNSQPWAWLVSPWPWEVK